MSRREQASKSLWVPENLGRSASPIAAGRSVALIDVCRRQPTTRGLGGVTTKTIQADRAVPEIHRVVTAAAVNPQVRRPDKFSAPHNFRYTLTNTFDPAWEIASARGTAPDMAI